MAPPEAASSRAIWFRTISPSAARAGALLLDAAQTLEFCTIETRVGAASPAFFFSARDVGLDAALPNRSVHSRAGAVVPTPASAQMRVLWVSFRKMLPKINVKPATIIG